MNKEQLYAEWKARLEQAAEDRQKLVTFHYIVLTNAAMLEGDSGASFCEAVGVPAGFGAEFNQMISLYRFMEKRETWIVHKI